MEQKMDHCWQYYIVVWCDRA